MELLLPNIGSRIATSKLRRKMEPGSAAVKYGAGIKRIYRARS
jgi:hypothetical protein